MTANTIIFGSVFALFIGACIYSLYVDYKMRRIGL